MKRVLGVVVLVLVVGAVAAVLAWRLRERDKPRTELALFGNVDLRQVDLAFNNNERIETVLVQEGDRVTKGQLVATLDVSRLKPQVQQAESEVAAQTAVVERLHNGSRPEEIAQARANVDSARADARNAQARLERLQAASSTTQGRAVSKQDIDNAKTELDAANAKLEVANSALQLLVIGPRKEDIAQGEAMLRADQAHLAMLRQQLDDASLFAPLDATVRSRLMEPGEMSSPQRPVFTLAITDPKWVRAYVAETDLGKLRPGMKVTITSDSFPNRTFDGWIGFISSVAEFTPKPVQTEELRTKLVYEVRAFVNDPKDELRLGMPATVHVSLTSAPTPPGPPASTDRSSPP